VRDFSFIRLAGTLAKANDLGESPEIEQKLLGQIHLKPKDPLPYVQVTQSKDPIVLGTTFVAKIIDFWGNEETITSHVALTQITEDGIQQLKIRLAYLPTDYGGKLVHLKLEMDDTSNQWSYFSNYFLLTDWNISKTSRIDYVDRNRNLTDASSKDGSLYQSIRLQFYFNDDEIKTDTQTYYQVTRNQHINPRILEKEVAQWKAPYMSSWVYLRLQRALNGLCYINQVRQYKIEGKLAPREGKSNFAEQSFVTDPDDQDELFISQVIIGGSTKAFRVNSGVKINDPGNYRVNTTVIPV